MKHITLTTCAAAMLAFAACNNEQTADIAKNDSTSTEKSADNKPAEKIEMPDSATATKRWMEYSTPGDMHKKMASWDGTWTADISMQMSADAPPVKSTGTMVNKMALGGRYQTSINTGDMMGMPFEGRQTLAYDNMKKTFISTWIDNMGTGVMVLEGPWDEATKSLTLTGKMVEPSMATEINVKEVLKVIDDDHHLFEMWAPGADGKEFKTMEIRYTRKK